MHTASLYLCSTPACEDCAQVGGDGYLERARAECKAYIAQLRRQFGNEPSGCKLYVAENPHDFGTYLSVNVQYDRNDMGACNWAFRLENEQPEYWDAEACQELGVGSIRDREGAEVSDGR